MVSPRFKVERVALLAALLSAGSTEKETTCGVDAFATPSPLRLGRVVSPFEESCARRMFNLYAAIDSDFDEHSSFSEPTLENHQDAEKSDGVSARVSTDPAPFFVSLLQKVSADHKLTIGAAALAMVLMMTPDSAVAAMSGGRMGGSFASPGPSRVAPSRGGGGGFSSGGRNYYGGGARSRTYISPGYGVGLAPVAPIMPMPYYSPFAVPRPMFYGGPGSISYNRGPSLFDLLFIGGIGFFILNTIRNASTGNEVSFDNITGFGGRSDALLTPLGRGTSVVQVTVALEVANRDDRKSILSVLDRLAATSDTGSKRGIQNLTSEVALELLRRKSSIVSGASRYKHFSERDAAQRDFSSLSIKERGKFEQETVSKYGGVYSAGSKTGNADLSSKATLAVVTLMIHIDGDSTKIPKINSMQDIEEALRKLASDVKVADCLQSAEILWTPEDRSEVLTSRDIVADYPELSAV